MATRELSPRARRMLPIGIVLLAVGSYLRMQAGTGEDGPVVDRLVVRGETMGTTYAVTVPPGTDAQSLRGRVQGVLDDVEGRMSTYRDDSELSRLNRAPAGAEPEPSEALREVFAVALDVGRRSGGALDVTVGPLVDAWGFGPAAVSGPPDGAELRALLAHTGPGAVRLERGRLRKRDDAVACDLSAVAKGYAVDRVAQALDRAGFSHYLVEVGGELRARGQRPDGGPWRVGLEQPDGARGDTVTTLPLRDVGVATSGDYRNFHVVDGQRRAHILDPRTGKPVSHGLASVTVVHPRVAYADAWATALSVLGPEQGMSVARREGVSAFFIVRTGEGALRSSESPAFSRYLSGAPPLAAAPDVDADAGS